MAGNFQPPPRVKNGIDEYKYRLSAAPIQGATKPASLAFSLVANQPRIDVYTNVPNDKNNGNIRAAMDGPTFWALIELLKLALDKEPGFKVSVPNKNYTWFQQKRSDEPVPVSTTVIGKDKEGVVFIALTAKDRPLIMFKFLPSLFHTIMHGDGTPYSPAELSVVYARGFANGLPLLFASVADTHYQEPKPKDAPTGGGGGGGYQNNRPAQNTGGGGGGDSFEDDFPM